MVRRRSTAGVALLPWWPAIQLVSDVVKGVEALGATIMVNGGLPRSTTMPYRWSGWGSCKKATVGSAGGRDRRSSPGSRLSLSPPSSARLSSIQLGKLAVLGRIVVIRIVLSFSVQAEIDGTWSHLASDSGAARTVGIGLALELCTYRRILAFAVWNSSSVIAPEAFNSASLASSSALSWGPAASWT